ncbi:MAG: glycine cleavage system protein H [Bryobacteraceae bacterium]
MMQFSSRHAFSTSCTFAAIGTEDAWAGGGGWQRQGQPENPEIRSNKVMVVLLVLVTFAIFIAIDLVLSRHRLPVAIAEAQEPEQAAIGQEVLSGFHIPANLKYHPGHTWMQKERKNVHRVGADELAAVLAGPVDRIELPKPGQWVRQGQKVFAFFRGDEKIEMVSPVEGEVVEVNRELAENPRLLLEDPYGRGWLMTVFAPDEESPARNLLPSSLIPAWIRESAETFYRFQPQFAGATAADGGRASREATAALPVERWKEAAKALLLS